MPKYYLYYAWAGDERIKPMQARSRSEALEELRTMWDDKLAVDKDRYTAYLAIEVRGAVDIPAEDVTWESPDMCSDRWLVEYPDDGHGNAGGCSCFPSYEMAMDDAMDRLLTRDKVTIKAWSATGYEALVTLEA